MSHQKNNLVHKTLKAYLPQKPSHIKKKNGVFLYILLLCFIAYGAWQDGILSASINEAILILIKQLLIGCYLIVLVGLCFFIHTIVHELGHAFAGILQGMKVNSITIWCWRYERVASGFQWRRAASIGGIAGVASFVLDTDRGCKLTRINFMIYVLGGVFANFLFVCLAYLLLQHLTGRFLSLIFILNAFIAIGFLLCVVNLFPWRMRNGWCTDGMLALKAWSKEEWNLNKSNMYLLSLNANGIFPRFWNPSDLPTEEALEKDGISFSCKMYGYFTRLLYALDVDDQRGAEQNAAWIAKNFYQIPEGVRQGFAVQMSYFSIQCLQNKDVFNAWRPLCEDGLYNLITNINLLDAMDAYLCQNDAQVKVMIQRTRDSLPQLPTQAHIDEMEKQISVLESKLSLR